MMRHNLVAVVTPVFNSKRTLLHAISSVLNQNPPHIHVLVDDGSTDGSVATIKQFADKYSSIVLVQRERKPDDLFTSSNAMNVGLKFVLNHTDAEFVTRHDSDDILTKDSLSKRILTFDDSVGAVFSWHDMFNEFGIYDTYAHKLRGTDRITKRAIFGRGFPYHTLIWRRSVMEEMLRLSYESGFLGDFYDNTLDFHEDLEFTLRMLEALQNLNLSLGYVDEITLNMRSHSRSICAQTHALKALNATFRVWSRYSKEIGLLALAQMIEMVCIRPYYHGLLAKLDDKESLGEEYYVPDKLRWYECGNEENTDEP